ncbi:lysylphosphatidylglycerol synthase domain-containing protein [Picosynechococcus sp. NKBG042902]|uniref:lysylphosphatidylglycerol synthase domain-containing protein n=1 Tax=Picosynechococcus sp. NKBG042902 TaxID=490193 RepID=UPI0004A9E2E3|nr:lysylphosphatidylglycerol synthase domain-containing protein [Picosynechococcus sp. NKBG042902]
MIDRKSDRQRFFKKHFLSGISLVICAVAVGVIWQEFRRIDWPLVWENLNHLSGAQLGLASFFVVCSYGAIANYDLLAFRYLQRTLDAYKIAFTGLITYAISPNVGFAFLSGSMLRYRLYRQWQVSHLEIAQVIAFTNLSLWVGLLPISGIIFTIFEFPLPTGIQLPFFAQSLQGFGILCLGISALYVLGSWVFKKPLQWRNYQFKFPSLKLSLQQVLVFSLDWGFAALALHSLLAPPLNYPVFFGVYVLAMVAGLVSTIPGGLGIFETVILFFLQDTQPEEVILATLIVFRGLYYLLPFAIAVAALLLFEYRQTRKPKQF